MIRLWPLLGALLVACEGAEPLDTTDVPDGTVRVEFAWESDDEQTRLDRLDLVVQRIEITGDGPDGPVDILYVGATELSVATPPDVLAWPRVAVDTGLHDATFTAVLEHPSGGLRANGTIDEVPADISLPRVTLIGEAELDVPADGVVVVRWVFEPADWLDGVDADDDELLVVDAGSSELERVTSNVEDSTEIENEDDPDDHHDDPDDDRDDTDQSDDDDDDDDDDGED
jgi:hypothetical protein